MRLLITVILLLAIGLLSYGQDVKDPYKGKQFKPGDTRLLNLQIPVGKIIMNYTIQYTLLDDPDGMFYSYGHRYKAEINKATLIGSNKTKITEEIAGWFTGRVVELTEKEIKQKAIRTTSMFYWFTVQDINLDGKPDFAIIGDLGYHSSPVNYYTWVNINDRLVYWHRLSDVVSGIKDVKQRILYLDSIGNGRINSRYYRVEQDTFLVAMEIAEN